MSETSFQSGTGSGRLVVSMPHVGHYLPDSLRLSLGKAAQSIDDADWHVDRLYDFIRTGETSWIAADWSRWFVDLNRPPDDISLYPGQATTGLCPTLSFSGEPLYRTGHAPDAGEIARRLDACWRPYHARLAQLLSTAKARHGTVRLLDAHSIVGVCPRLFDGRLPDINIGTNDGTSCSAVLIEEIRAVLAGQTAFTWVVDGRFKGGYITRHYGRPAEGVEAVQIELAQSAYMDELDPSAWDDARAEPLRTLLRKLLDILSR